MSGEVGDDVGEVGGGREGGRVGVVAGDDVLCTVAMTMTEIRTTKLTKLPIIPSIT
jgi:hypothetical protein